jgi:hypothetical protein
MALDLGAATGGGPLVIAISAYAAEPLSFAGRGDGLLKTYARPRLGCVNHR